MKCAENVFKQPHLMNAAKQNANIGYIHSRSFFFFLLHLSNRNFQKSVTEIQGTQRNERLFAAFCDKNSFSLIIQPERMSCKNVPVVAI